ncbi:MAG: type III-A CRISPR-associated RAMP protein Csm3, partial [Pyrodictiaceae archaeon]
ANYKQIEDGLKKNNINRNPMDYFKILAPTRLLVSDFFPSEDYVKRINAWSVADFLEEKSENRIDRITSAADPRSIVRVKPGVEFEGTASILFFDNDCDMVSRYLNTFATGLRLLEETYLGGSGSRGYGRVRFKELGVSGFKISKRDEAPVIEDIKELSKKYSSIDELAGEIEKIAAVIRAKIYGSTSCES